LRRADRHPRKFTSKRRGQAIAQDGQGGLIVGLEQINILGKSLAVEESSTQGGSAEEMELRDSELGHGGQDVGDQVIPPDLGVADPILPSKMRQVLGAQHQAEAAFSEPMTPSAARRC
jgi:hypothetical protein